MLIVFIVFVAPFALVFDPNVAVSSSSRNG